MLNVLAKKRADQPITTEDWQRIFQRDGYTRLKKREMAMKNSFEDEDFKTFVLSGKLLEQKQALEETLAKWKRADTTRAAQLVLAYLPKNFNSDLKAVEKFFFDILQDRLSREEMQKKGFSFFGVQGAWYTVGWKMSVMIEKTYGKARLIECICDQRELLSTYDKAAAKYDRRTRQQLALWSESLIRNWVNR